MNKDVRIGTNYPIHPKIRRLEKILGAEGIKSHIFLLCFVGSVAPDGLLEDMEVEDIEIAAKLKGALGDFVDTLLKLKLLDYDGMNYSIHNWRKHNLYCASSEARSESARRSAIIGWLIRRNLIPKKSRIPPGINLNRGYEKIVEEILAFNANRNAERNAPSPPPKGVLVETPPLGGRVSPTLTENQCSSSDYDFQELALQEFEALVAKHNGDKEGLQQVFEEYSDKDPIYLYQAAAFTNTFYEPKNYAYSVSRYLRDQIVQKFKDE